MLNHNKDQCPLNTVSLPLVAVYLIKQGSVSMVILVYWELPGCYRCKYVHYVQDPCEGGDKQQVSILKTWAQNQSNWL